MAFDWSGGTAFYGLRKVQMWHASLNIQSAAFIVVTSPKDSVKQVFSLLVQVLGRLDGSLRLVDALGQEHACSKDYVSEQSGITHAAFVW